MAGYVRRWTENGGGDGSKIEVDENIDLSTGTKLVVEETRSQRGTWCPPSSTQRSKRRVGREDSQLEETINLEDEREEGRDTEKNR